MTQTKYTQSPWETEHFGCDVVTPRGELIAKCGESVMLSGDERKANARLIAAAPELFEAWKDWFHAVAGESPSGEQAAIKKARIAVAKAEGRAA